MLSTKACLPALTHGLVRVRVLGQIFSDMGTTCSSLPLRSEHVRGDISTDHFIIFVRIDILVFVKIFNMALLNTIYAIRKQVYFWVNT